MKPRPLARFSALALAAVALLLSGRDALACAACYNVNAGSKMGNAANWGIIAMVIIMFGMLGAVAGFGFYLAYRAKHPLPDYNDLLREGEGHPPEPEPAA